MALAAGAKGPGASRSNALHCKARACRHRVPGPPRNAQDHDRAARVARAGHRRGGRTAQQRLRRKIASTTVRAASAARSTRSRSHRPPTRRRRCHSAPNSCTLPRRCRPDAAVRHRNHSAPSEVLHRTRWPSTGRGSAAIRRFRHGPVCLEAAAAGSGRVRGVSGAATGGCRVEAAADAWRHSRPPKRRGLAVVVGNQHEVVQVAVRQDAFADDVTSVIDR
jgi:hypothetical protein